MNTLIIFSITFTAIHFHSIGETVIPLYAILLLIHYQQLKNNKYMHIKHLTSSSICNGMHNNFLLLIFFLQYYYTVEKYNL